MKIKILSAPPPPKDVEITMKLSTLLLLKRLIGNTSVAQRAQLCTISRDQAVELSDFYWDLHKESDVQSEYERMFGF